MSQKIESQEITEEWVRERLIEVRMKKIHDEMRKSIGLYSTKLMEIQLAAIKKFWLDPFNKEPHRSETIIKWLVKEFKISRHLAVSIDAIIRPEHLKKQGRPKKEKKENEI